MPISYTTLPYPLNLGPLGQIEGLTLSSPQTTDPACHYIGGLPYALPPVGPYRFRAPRHLPSHFRYGTRANPGRYAGQTAVCPQPDYRAPADKTFWDEDCLQLNIWIPAGTPPEGGWPVFINLHGGWLQFGTANMGRDGIAELISETALRCIFIMPSYRLNCFGFLCGRELEAEAARNGETFGNMGFWDQRAALEWTSAHIARFGGNAGKITVGGYSAGSHSAFQQLAHDLNRPNEQAIIKRIIMWSNGPGVQPKAVPEQQDQFDEVLTALGIPQSLTGSEKLERLRALPAQSLVDVQAGLKLSEFRAVLDGAFVSKTTMRDINNGTFARKVKQRGIKIMNGECRDEHYCYGQWRKPQDSYDSFYQRLLADYPRRCVDSITQLRFPDQKLPSDFTDWMDAFGKVYADIQVHSLERGFAERLSAGGLTVGKDLLRYRINWRAKCVDAVMPAEWKVTHASDMAIWFWGTGAGDGLTDEEKEIARPLNEVFAAMVNIEDLEWSELGNKQMLRLRADGKMDMWEDDQWEHGIAVWNAVNGDVPRLESSKL